MRRFIKRDLIGKYYEMVYDLDTLVVGCVVSLMTPLRDLIYGHPEIPSMNATSSNILSAMLACETLMQDGRMVDVISKISAQIRRAEKRLVGNIIVIPKKG